MACIWPCICSWPISFEDPHAPWLTCDASSFVSGIRLQGRAFVSESVAETSASGRGNQQLVDRQREGSVARRARQNDVAPTLRTVCIEAVFSVVDTSHEARWCAHAKPSPESWWATSRWPGCARCVARCWRGWRPARAFQKRWSCSSARGADSGAQQRLTRGDGGRDAVDVRQEKTGRLGHRVSPCASWRTAVGWSFRSVRGVASLAGPHRSTQRSVRQHVTTAILVVRSKVEGT